MNAEELFGAIRVVAEQVLEEAKIDKTIVGSVSQGPLDDGSYMVTYFFEELKCFPQGVSKYQIGEMVRVTIPEGDFNKKKIITGVTSERVEDLQDDIGGIIVGDGYNYLVSPKDWSSRTGVNEEKINLDSKLISGINNPSNTHLRISSEVFTDADIVADSDFGIELKIRRKSGSDMILKLGRKQMQGNLSALNGKIQTAIFEIGEEEFDAVGADAKYYTAIDSARHISFKNSYIDLINKDISNSIMQGLYQIEIIPNGATLTASVSNDEFGELDTKGDTFKYTWFKAEYLSDGTKKLTELTEKKKTINKVAGVTYYEVKVEVE